MRWDGTGWDGMGWDGMGWDGYVATSTGNVAPLFDCCPSTFSHLGRLLYKGVRQGGKGGRKRKCRRE